MDYKIVCLDVHDPKVREVMLSVVPEGFHLEMADTYEPDEQMNLGAEADFIMTGWAPEPEAMIRSAKKLKLIQKWHRSQHSNCHHYSLWRQTTRKA